jgi:hypothetical protein
LSNIRLIFGRFTPPVSPHARSFALLNPSTKMGGRKPAAATSPPPAPAAAASPPRAAWRLTEEQRMPKGGEVKPQQRRRMNTAGDAGKGAADEAAMAEEEDTYDDTAVDEAEDKKHGRDQKKGADGKGGGKGKGKRKKATTDESGHVSIPFWLLEAMLKMLLKHSLAIAELTAITIWTVLISVESKIVERTKHETTMYHENVQKMGKGHLLGPPHVHAFLGLLDALVEVSEEKKMDDEIQMRLKAYRVYLNAKPQEEVLTLIKMCKIAKAYNKEKCKVMFKVEQPLGNAELIRTAKTTGGSTPPSENEIEIVSIFGDIHWGTDLVKAMMAGGGEKKEGKAPPGYLEQCCSYYLEK